MRIGIGISRRMRTPSGSSAIAAKFQSVNADGWSTTYAAPPTFDPVGNPEKFTVTRSGFNSSGGAITFGEDLTMMQRIRQPYPSQASLTTNQAAVSDFIYAGETIAGGATNNSTRAYPKPQAMWLTPDLERATSNTFVVRLAVAHAHARNGKPVAAVKFIVSDGTNSTNVTVSAMTTRQFASGLYGAFYEATLDVSTLAAATICTVDAIIYPWVGTAYQISVDGSAYPSSNLTVLKFLNDRTGSYGTAYAYVATTGNDGTGVVSTTAATASASPYLTVAAAASAIKTFNNANFGRLAADGGIIRLQAGTYTPGYFTGGSTTNYPLTIEAANPANKSTTIMQDSGANDFTSWPTKVRVRNLTLRKTSVNVTFIDNGAGTGNGGNFVTFENVTFDRNGTSDHTLWIGYIGRAYINECDSPSSFACFNKYNGSAPKQFNVIGSDLKSGAGEPSTMFYNAFASKVSAIGMVRGNAAMEDSLGQLFAFNFVTTNGEVATAANGSDPGVRGMAMVMNVLEDTATTEINPNSEFAGFGATDAQNIVLIGNTIVGGRSLFFYNDTAGTRPVRSGYVRFNVIESTNVKSDVFAADGLNVNNWAARYHVGWRSNCHTRGDYNGNGGPGAASWMGDVLALGSVSGSIAGPANVAFVSDASGKGTGAGNGDYTPGAGSVIPKIPAGLAAYPIDMKGRTITDDGTCEAGAIRHV